MAAPGRSNDPVDITNIEDICTDWAQKKYGSKYTVVSVDTKALNVSKEHINYSESDKEVRRIETIHNLSSDSLNQELSGQSTKTSSCGSTKHKGHQVSGGLSANAGPPAAVGLGANIGAQIQRSHTKTEMSGKDETSTHGMTHELPPWTTLHTEKTHKEVTMPYTLLRLEGKVSIKLQKGNGNKKTKSVDVTEIYPKEKTVKGPGGKKSVLLNNKKIFEAFEQEVKVKHLDPDKIMKRIHNDLLRDKSAKIVEEVKDKRALSKLLEVMSSEQVISEEQFKTVSQSPTVQECVDNLVRVLENAETEKFLVFVNILQKEGYGRLAKLLDPRPIYPDTLKTVSNLNDFGVVDHFFVTRKVSKVKNSLQNTKIVIIHGICGSGKTQLMFKVASDHERDYASVHPGAVVWVIDGTSRDTIANGVDSLRQRLTGDTETGKTRLQSLVDQRSHALLLIDDLPAENVKHIPKELLNCSAKMLITTQNPALQHKFTESKNVLMDGFTEDEAVSFLADDLPSSTPREHIKELAQSFSCLPLGLASARGTIQECNMTLGEYKERLHGGKDDVVELMDMGDEWLQDYYKEGYADAGRNIFAALQMAVNTLDDQCKYMLQLCAFLMPQNIPMLMLKGEHRASDLRFVRDLKRRSLGYIEGEGVKRRLFIHGVTQMALRLQMDREQQTANCANKLLRILVKFFSKDTMYSEMMYKFSVSLMPHVRAVLKHADKLDLGPEYPLMKARLLMVCGHLLIQKGATALSEGLLNDAGRLLLEFVGINDFHAIAQDLDNFTEGVIDASAHIQKALAETSRSLEDSYIQDTVICRVITKQHLRVLSGKLDANDRKTLEDMVENFEPLTMEMYRKLVDNKLAYPVETLKSTFLLELHININFKNIKVAGLYDNFKAEIPDFPMYIVLRMLQEACYMQIDEDLRDRKPTIIPHLKVVAGLYNQILAIKETVRFYDFGLLMSEGIDILTTLNSYNMLVCCYTLMMVTYADADDQSDYMTRGKEMCKKLLELSESESKAGNPPLGLAEYYMRAGMFKMNVCIWRLALKKGDYVGLLKEAADLFWKAYRVELKREENHPRLGEALICLIDVRIKQNELRRARVCARRLLQLTQDHWPGWLTGAERQLARVRSMIVVWALKQNMEEQKSKLMKVTTV